MAPGPAEIVYDFVSPCVKSEEDREQANDAFVSENDDDRNPLVFYVDLKHPLPDVTEMEHEHYHCWTSA